MLDIGLFQLRIPLFSADGLGVELSLNKGYAILNRHNNLTGQSDKNTNTKVYVFRSNPFLLSYDK